MKVRFQYGETLPAGDSLAQWIVKLGMVANDLTFAHRKLREADEGSWEHLYWWRVAIAHYNEALLRLESDSAGPEVSAYISGLPEKVRALHEEALAIYAVVRKPSNRIRSETIFHYPNDSTTKLLAAVLTDLGQETGTIDGGESGKLKDARLLFADDVVRRLFFKAAGDDKDKADATLIEIADGVTALIRFINNAADIYFYERLTGVKPAE